MSFNIVREEMKWGNLPLSLETGKIARQACGSVVASYGEAVVLVTVVHKRAAVASGFVPLNVQFLSKSYAVGRIPGGFMKREGKPSEREVLASRIIDRSIRPLFPDGFQDEVSVVCQLLAYDMVSPPEVPALVGVAAALSISGLPFDFQIAGCKVGLDDDGGFVCNVNPADPNAVEKLSLFLAGTKDSLLMVEAESSGLSAETMLDAIVFGKNEIAKVIDFVNGFVQKTGKARSSADAFVMQDTSKVADLCAEYEARFVEAYTTLNKRERSDLLEALRKDVIAEAVACGLGEIHASFVLKQYERDFVRGRMLDSGRRIDGRLPNEVREVTVEVDVLPRAHGSALFTRGDTQVLAVTALGGAQDEQIVDDLDGDRRERFLLHYNFPPYAVGEATPMRPPGRREIGHGKLAQRAVRAVLPDKDDFPYTLRVVSEVTESDGSSSMATVCGASLSLMDAGVPVRNAVSGIAMGMVKEGDRCMILSDIMGDEDYLGDMDFKIAGTKDGITAMQMDVKIRDLSLNLLAKAIQQAEVGRMHIMSCMNKVLSESRLQPKVSAPSVLSFAIDRDKIRYVIGSGGKNIREICEKSGARVDIEQDGSVVIVAPTAVSVELARDMILGCVVEPEVGALYDGKVSKVTDFGLFVEFLGGKRGMVHVSEVSLERVNSLNSMFSVGDVVSFIILGVDKGKYRLSIRRVSGDVIDDERDVAVDTHEVGADVVSDVTEESADTKLGNDNASVGKCNVTSRRFFASKRLSGSKGNDGDNRHVVSGEGASDEDDGNNHDEVEKKQRGNVSSKAKHNHKKKPRFF